MLKKRIYISLFVIMVLGHISLYAQSDSVVVVGRDTTTTIGEDIASREAYDAELETNINLPPLALFFDNIEKHPSVGIYQTYKDEAMAGLGEEKQKWLDYLSVVANYQYGKYNSLSENSNISGSQFFLANNANNTYRVGVSMTIPIGNAASRNKRIKSHEAVLKRVQFEHDIAVENRKFLILEAYNAVVVQLATLKSKSESAALYDAQIRIIEEDFKMGKVDIVGLSIERARRANAIVIYEEGKVSLYNSIIFLEMLSDVKILDR